MKLTSLIVYNETILRQISRPTSIAEIEKLEIIPKIQKALLESWIRGYGLSAIQVGHPLRVAYYNIKGKEVILLNPEISDFKNKIRRVAEGCLSIPYKSFQTERFDEITLKNYYPGSYSGVIKGTEAAIIQHEIDHMNGVLVMDRLYNKVQKRNELCNCGSGKKFKKCCI